METAGFVLPTIATLALGTALLVPLRDGRRGRRASLPGGAAPLRRDFPALAPLASAEDSCSAAVLDDTLVATPATALDPQGPEGAARDDRSTASAQLPPDAAAQPEMAPEVFVSSPVADATLAREDRKTVTLPAPLRTATASLATRIAAFVKSLRPAPDTIPENSFARAVDLVERSFAEELEAVLQPPSADSAPQPVQSTTSAADFVVVSARPVPERVVPLTRVPLRPQRDACTWPILAGATHEGDSRAQRHGLLQHLRRKPVPELAETLALAYREEDQPGRLLVLRALMRCESEHAKRAFAEALHSGTDDERALAVEGLAAAGNRADVAPALCDRVDAVAARAALAFVGTHRREDYRIALAPYLEASRIETILALLAGLVE